MLGWESRLKVDQLVRRCSRRELRDVAHRAALMYWYEMRKRELAERLVEFCPREVEELLTNDDR